jgi:general secretion pathway protein G
MSWNLAWLAASALAAVGVTGFLAPSAIATCGVRLAAGFPALLAKPLWAWPGARAGLDAPLVAAPAPCKIQKAALPAANAHSAKVMKRVVQIFSMAAIIIQPMKNLHTLTSRLQRGFTMIELLVVMGILALLGAIVVPQFLDRFDDAKMTTAKTDITTLYQQLKLYKFDNQRYPTAEQGLQALTSKPTVGPIPLTWRQYVEKLPKDPWGNEYKYLNPGIKGEIDVMSFGADGVAGGEGKNADLGSWQ